jgi:hypothetical protein
MENGLNFEKPLRLLRQAKEWQEQDGSRNVRIHSSCITISCYYRLQRILGKETLYLIAHIGLLKLLKKT